MYEFASKGEAADRRFRESAEAKKQADNIINNLDSIIRNRDFARFHEIFKDEGFSDAYREHLGISSQPAVEPVYGGANYSDEDARLVNELKSRGYEIEVDDLLGAKQAATGYDNPQISVMQEQIEALQKQLTDTLQTTQESTIANQAALIERDFENVAKEYPSWVRPSRVVDYIRRTGKQPNEFRQAFEDVKAEIEKEMTADREAWLAEKNANNSKLISGVNGSGKVFTKEGMEGKSYAERIKALRKQ